jgi:hypothetical protein
LALDPATPVPERASAIDRELVISTLRENFERQRLSLETFSARVEHAYGARSRAQLDELVVDLPRERSALARAISATVARLSRWAACLQTAWRDPRTPRLALPARDSVTLGRRRDCDCVLTDPTVSRRHARLRFESGTWWLRDLRSANGTRVNGCRLVDEVEVRPGDRVSFGAVTYRLGSPR